MTPQAKQAVEQSPAEATQEVAERVEQLTVRAVVSGEGMLAIVFILPSIIAFFFLLAMPTF